MNVQTHNLDTLHEQVEQRPGDSQTWTNLGLALISTAQDSVENHAASNAALHHALSLSPPTSALCLQIANGLRQLGTTQVAVAAYERALDLDESLDEARGNMAELLLDESPESAVELLLQPIAQRSQRWEIPFVLAKAYHKLGRLEEANAEAHRAIQISDAQLPAFWLYAQLLGESNASQACIEAWKQVVERSPGDAQAATALGSALVAGGHPEAGVAILSDVAKERPEATEVWLNLCLAQSAAKQPSLAADSAEKAIELAPDSAQAYYLLGQAKEQLSNPKAAAAAFEAATKKRPDWAEAYRSLGRVQNVLGKRERARWALLRATELDPADKTLRSELAKLLRNSKPPPAASASGAIAGQIQDFSLGDTIELLRNMRMTGRLEVTSGISSGSIVISYGMISGAASPTSRSILQHLQTAKLVEATDIAATMKRSRLSAPNLVADELQKQGLVSQQDLQETRARQVRCALKEMLDWSKGKFVFHKSEAPPNSDEMLLDPTGLMMDIMRAKDEETRHNGAH